MVPNLPAPIRPTVTGRPAASRSSNMVVEIHVTAPVSVGDGNIGAGEVGLGGALAQIAYWHSPGNESLDPALAGLLLTPGRAARLVMSTSCRSSPCAGTSVLAAAWQSGRRSVRAGNGCGPTRSRSAESSGWRHPWRRRRHSRRRSPAGAPMLADARRTWRSLFEEAPDGGEQPRRVATLRLGTGRCRRDAPAGSHAEPNVIVPANERRQATARSTQLLAAGGVKARMVPMAGK